jgi:cytidine diphosphoramidate kinase
VSDRRIGDVSKRHLRGVIWITGLSAAGKTTLAREVLSQLRQRHVVSLMLDGDALRDTLQDPGVGYDRGSRLIHARRVCRLAKMFSEQDIVVVVATISLLHQIHVWNRAHLPGYWEVFIKADINQCCARDSKGLYRQAMGGLSNNVVGIDLIPEFPLNPHLVVENDGDSSTIPFKAEGIVEAFLRDIAGRCESPCEGADG